MYQYKTLHRKLKIYISIQNITLKTKDLYINTKHYTENLIFIYQYKTLVLLFILCVINDLFYNTLPAIQVLFYYRMLFAAPS